MTASFEGFDPDPPTGPGGPDFTYWLGLLRDGTEVEKSRARTEIGLILESRGQIEAAAEAYLTNVKARVRDRRPYERLAAICRDKGDPEWEARVLLAMHSVFAALPRNDAPDPSTPARSINPRLIALLAGVFVLVGLMIAAGGVLAARQIDIRQVPSRILARIWPASPPALVTASGFPCINPVGHFPQWADTEGAVRTAVDVRLSGARYSFSPFMRRLWEMAVHDPDRSVAGWMAAHLAASHTRTQAPELADLIADQAMLRASIPTDTAYELNKRIVPDAAWQSLLRLPTTDCVGSMLQHPANARLVRLMSLYVIKP